MAPPELSFQIQIPQFLMSFWDKKLSLKKKKKNKFVLKDMSYDQWILLFHK